MPILRNEKGEVTAIVCSRPTKKRCTFCGQYFTEYNLCDYEIGNGKTCDAVMCGRCTWSPEKGKDYCRMHRRKIEEPQREERHKRDLTARKRDTLVFFTKSRYASFCREKDCSNRWEKDDPCYWDSQTREVFCTDCGEMLQQ